MPKMYTTDMPSLQTKKNHYVFAYGTLKYGFPRYEALAKTKGIKLLGSGYTNGANYVMYNLEGISSPSFPLVFEDQSPEMGDFVTSRVAGDLLLVPTEVMYQLDAIENNGGYYTRHPRNVTVMAKVPTNDGKFLWTQKTVDAWVYIANIGTWYRGSRMRRIKPSKNNVLKYSLEQCYDFVGASNQESAIRFLK